MLFKTFNIYLLTLEISLFIQKRSFKSTGFYLKTFQAENFLRKFKHK